MADQRERVRRPVIKIAIDKRASESENRRHEEGLASGSSARCSFPGLSARRLSAADRLRAEEAGDSDSTSASYTKRGTSGDRRDYRTLCGHQAGELQHGDVQLPGRDYVDRFEKRAYHAGVQENERKKMRRAEYSVAKECKPPAAVSGRLLWLALHSR
jgi:hypothetical protein